MISDYYKELFLSRLKPNGDCLIYDKGIKNNKYGVFHINGQKIKAHRVSWIINFGEIPKGMFICHKCDNPSCVKSDHLFLGTPKDNAVDMAKKNRNYVRRGEISPWTTITEETAKEIIIFLNQKIPLVKIAERLNINVTIIGAIKRRSSWKHLGANPNNFHHGQLIGETHHNSKLKKEDVIKIRQLIKTGLSQPKIAEQFNVKQTVISKIKLKKLWAHLPEE